MIVRSAVFGVILSVLSVIPASAQDERGFVRGLVGVTFGTAETSMLFGGGGGFSVGKGVQIVGEFGRMNDVLPEDLKDQLDFITALLTAQLGVPVSLDVTAPAIYGMGGARYTVPRVRVRPFGEVQAGWAHISFDIDAEVAGLDLSREVEDAADLESGD